MINNLIIFSGPHGSGKTTLVNHLKKCDDKYIVPELLTRTAKFYSNCNPGSDSNMNNYDNVNYFHRQSLKHAQRALENYEYMSLALKNPDKIIFGNRGFYDVESYDCAYHQLGWINDVEKDILDCEFYSKVFDCLSEPRTIVVNPGFDICKKHLEKRWESNEKKFKEDNLGYLSAVCRSFEKYVDYPNVYYIDHEIDLNDKSLLGVVCKWIGNVENKEKCLDVSCNNLMVVSN